MKTLIKISLLALLGGIFLSSCSDDDEESITYSQDDYNYVGLDVGNFSKEEWYPGGELGTTLNVSNNSYQDETPAVTSQGLTDAFRLGEMFFERNFTIDSKPYNGLGPAYVRKSCLDCHPSYGHGKRQTSYSATFGNGYLLVIYHPDDGDNSNDGAYISEVTGMPQTKATSPFLPPVDEDQISLTWKTVTAMESGLPLQFPDGETFELIYPELYIPESAFNTYPKPENLAFRLESTIGIMGTGLIDAIPQDSIKKQYELEAEYIELNPNYWDTASNNWGASALYTNWTSEGHLLDGSQVPSEGMLKRYTYALTRASLQDGAGANAIWNITNVSRSDRPLLYTTEAWADAMSMNQDVINSIKQDPSSAYYADGTDEGIIDAVKNLLNPNTNQFDNNWHNFSPEMSDANYYAFMVWHRGLAIPRARNLNSAEVQQGKRIFMELGCASCHRPSWTTGDDNYYVSDNIRTLGELPRYPRQKIYPYSDFIQHRLYMINDIHGSWCRTTPLWGRGLSLLNTGAEDRLHDCRARNEIEAIMWHAYSKQSDAYESAYKFYNLSKEDRDALVKFLKSI